MASQGKELAEPRSRLTLERVLRAAVELADEGGLEALTMRALADKLGVAAMSVYYYASGRDDILNGILDLVVTDMETASGGAGWRAAIRNSAISAHEALERHPWACGLIMSPARIRSGRIRFMEAMLARLREAGFSAEQTDLAYHALDSHIIGSTLWEVGYSDGSEGLEDYASAFLRTLHEDEYPYLAEHVRQHMLPPRPSESSFEFGLDLILDGLERIRTTAAGR